SKCNTALVDPALAAAAATALVNDARVMNLRAFSCRATSPTTNSPARRAWPRFSSAVAGTSLAPNGDKPIIDIANAMVLAVNCPPHAPAPGQALRSSSHSSFSSSLPAAHALAHRLRQLAQMQIARHDIGPGRDYGDQRLIERGIIEPGGAKHGARRRSRESLLQRIATQPNLQMQTKKKPPLRFTRAGAE